MFDQDRTLYERMAGMVIPNSTAGSEQFFHNSFSGSRGDHQKGWRPPNVENLQSIVTSLKSKVFRSRILATSNFPGFLEALSLYIEICKERKAVDRAKACASSD